MGLAAVAADGKVAAAAPPAIAAAPVVKNLRRDVVASVMIVILIIGSDLGLRKLLYSCHSYVETALYNKVSKPVPDLFYMGDDYINDKSKIAWDMVYQKKIICIFKNSYRATKYRVLNAT